MIFNNIYTIANTKGVVVSDCSKENTQARDIGLIKNLPGRELGDWAQFTAQLKDVFLNQNEDKLMWHLKT